MENQDTPNAPWNPPADKTATIPLPASLEPLIEYLAEQVHNRWAERRLQEGWRWGPTRDDKLKTTPNLVAYSDLPDIEKNYDRTTALTTLRNLYGSGYQIITSPSEPPSNSEKASRDVEITLNESGIRSFTFTDGLWRSHSPEFWAAHPQLLHQLAHRTSDAGWPLLTFDIISKALAAAVENENEKKIPPEIEAQLRHLAVLSLMEVGALDRATQELDKIPSNGKIAGELQGLRGRLDKMRGKQCVSVEEATPWFESARNTYFSACCAERDQFRRNEDEQSGTGAYYLGINAATMSAWAGHHEESRKMAGEVLELCTQVTACRDKKSKTTNADPWLEATRGEAHLLRGEGDDAKAAYGKAIRILDGRWRPLQSMRCQALETARRIGFPEAEVECWFHMPELHVVGLSEQPLVTPPKKSVVYFYLREAEQLELAAQILPESSEFHLGVAQTLGEFRRSLTTKEMQILDTLLAEATRLHGGEEARIIGDDIGPHLSHLLFRGAVLLRAQQLDLQPQGLTCLESTYDTLAPEGTASFRALLCADAKGYSRLDAHLLRVFVQEYLTCISDVVDRFREKTLTVKTAGDGLFIVFHDLASALRFSLDLRDTTASVNWAKRGMPDDLGLRISLDAGPMIEFTNPVTGHHDVAGRIVNRAARIEPITPVNHVYASHTVTTLALALDIPKVRFEYAGETPLPKGFGTFRLYHLTNA